MGNAKFLQRNIHERRRVAIMMRWNYLPQLRLNTVNNNSCRFMLLQDFMAQKTICMIDSRDTPTLARKVKRIIKSAASNSIEHQMNFFFFFFCNYRKER